MNELLKPLNIGLVGAGAIMKLSHAPTITRNGEAKVAGVFDPDPERAKAITSDYGGTAYGNLEAMLERRDIDAVVVANPNAHHAEAVLAAAAHGKHVFCEKPMALDIQQAQRMIDACRQAKVLLQVGFNQRYWSQVQIAKSLIDMGFIGNIHQARSVYSEKSTAYPAMTRYRYDLNLSGGATIIDLTIHRIDLLRYLVGGYQSIMAELTHSALPEAVDDNVWLLARFKNGARGSLSSNRYSPAIGDGTDLYGTEGSIHFVTETINPYQAVPLAIYTEKNAKDIPDFLREAHYPEAWWKSFEGGWISIHPPRKSPYDAQFRAFCRSIREGRPAEVDGEDGLRAQEVVQAAYLSVRDGRWIDLPLAADAPFVVPKY